MLSKDIFSYEYQSIVTRELQDGPMVFFNCDDVTQMTIERGGILNVVIYAIAGCVLLFLAAKLLKLSAARAVKSPGKTGRLTRSA